MFSLKKYPINKNYLQLGVVHHLVANGREEELFVLLHPGPHTAVHGGGGAPEGGHFLIIFCVGKLQVGHRTIEEERNPGFLFRTAPCT